MVRARHDGDQYAFDIDSHIREARIESAPAWTGAPLGFTTTYQAPAGLESAFEHWQLLHGSHGSVPRSHMWHRSIAAPAGTALGDHRIDLFSADLRCEPPNPSGHQGRCTCVGDLMHLVICEPCVWHTIAASENTVVESWHDHALPGWRDLPIVPTKVNQRDDHGFSKSTTAWIVKHYPAAAQVPGAPIVTERSTHGTRHVPGRSPWGGYDLSHTALDKHQVRRHPAREHDLGLRPAAQAEGRSISS